MDVARAAPADRRYFAIVALEELARAYREEAQGASVPAKADTDRRQALWRWRSSTQAYARDLDLLVAGIDDSGEIGVFVEPDASVRLLVAGRQVILASPRIREPNVLEGRIVERYCSMVTCHLPASATMTADAGGGDGSAAPSRESRPLPAPPGVDGVWSFGDRQGPVLQTSAGIHFAFRDAAELQRRKRVCLTLVHELQLLERQLRYFRSRGVLVEWPVLVVVADTASGRARVVLNRIGHSVLLDLPTLMRATSALETVKPWLIAQVENRRVQMPPIPAERLLAGLP